MGKPLPYSSELALLDFNLFRSLQNDSNDKNIILGNQLKTFWQTCSNKKKQTNKKIRNFYGNCIITLVEWWVRVVKTKGYYVIDEYMLILIFYSSRNFCKIQIKWSRQKHIKLGVLAQPSLCSILIEIRIVYAVLCRKIYSPACNIFPMHTTLQVYRNSITILMTNVQISSTL